ncbi:hypothetical protein [Streptomyces sp. KR55]|uniref:hypothetical protein n=1 Tax=Streptomyces sp. KR55 TaxID=3457425 RepID=UPI003FCFC4D7
MGAAVPGDKTVIDAYAPVFRAFHDAAHSGADVRTAHTRRPRRRPSPVCGPTPRRRPKGLGVVSGTAQHRPQGPGCHFDRLRA